MSNAAIAAAYRASGESPPTHYYVYKFRKTDDYPGGYYIYVCTVGTEKGAKDRVAELGPNAVYVIGHLIQGAFY